jgi:hypothetical protein
MSRRATIAIYENSSHHPGCNATGESLNQTAATIKTKVCRVDKQRKNILITMLPTTRMLIQNQSKFQTATPLTACTLQGKSQREYLKTETAELHHCPYIVDSHHNSNCLSGGSANQDNSISLCRHHVVAITRREMHNS